jgi:FkbM family methyltransferase
MKVLKIAILIPAYNCEATIDNTLRSLQSIESGWDNVDRVLLCDDCSSDNTVRVAESSQFNRCLFSIIKHEKNRGEAACYRTMMSAIPQGVEWFTILHSDDIALSCFLTRNIEIVGRCDDRVAAVSSNYYVFGAGLERMAHPAEDLIVFRGNAAEEIYHTATIGCWWHISGSLVNRKLWEQFGGRDPELPQLGDWDLMLRWQTAGYRIGHSLIPTTKSRIHAASVSSRSYREFRDLQERTKVVCSCPSVFTPAIKRWWTKQLAQSAVRRVFKLLLSGRIADSVRGISIGVRCVISLLHDDSPRWLKVLLALRYKAMMYSRWTGEFGLYGVWRLLRSRYTKLERHIHLKSKHFGPIVCRNCPEDFAAVNTVMCFGAYAAPFADKRFDCVLDLGANVGIATRYFLSQGPTIQVLAIEPSSENCAVFRINMEMVMAGDRVRLWECGIGGVEGKGYLRSSAGNRFDSFQVEYSHSEESPNHGRSVIIRKMASAIDTLSGSVLVKMDIEGSENELLACREDWIEKVDYMMVEFHDDAKERLWVSILGAEGWKCQKQFDTWHFAKESPTSRYKNITGFRSEFRGCTN